MRCPFCDKCVTTGKNTRERRWIPWLMDSYDRVLASHGNACAALVIHMTTGCEKLNFYYIPGAGQIKVTYSCTCGAGFPHVEPLAVHAWEMKDLTDEEHKAVGLLMGSQT